MGKMLLIVGPVLIVALVIVYAVYRTRRWRDRQILKRNPLALQKKGLDRDALLFLHNEQQENMRLRQALGNIFGLLTTALDDNTVTIWGPATQENVKRALETARKVTEE